MKNVPELRFPEFINDGEWEIKPLKKLAENLDNKRVPITSNVRSKGDIPYYGASGIVDFVNDYIFDEELLCISEDGANLVVRTYPIAFSISGKTWVNNHAHVLKFQNKCTQIIVENYLNSIKLDDFLTGMAQPKLNKAMLDIIPIPISSKPKEQQKIADCLSSIDNLITAQSKKVEILKVHKKGLMQQLFPQDGEEVPKLRFSEFKNAPEWEVKPLEKIGEITTGKTPSTSDEALWNGSIRFITPTDIDDDIKYQHNTSRTVVKQPSMKILKVGTITYTCIASIGKIAITTVPSITNQQINSITVYENINNEFVYYALLELTPYIKSKLANTTLPIINKTEFSKFEIKLPKPNEQKKIADCLSSIDELITSSAKKVETLKEHKKGLMQKLFPSNEVDR